MHCGTVTGVEWSPELGESGNIGDPPQTWLGDGKCEAGLESYFAYQQQQTSFIVMLNSLPGPGRWA